MIGKPRYAGQAFVSLRTSDGLRLLVRKSSVTMIADADLFCNTALITIGGRQFEIEKSLDEVVKLVLDSN